MTARPAETANLPARTITMPTHKTVAILTMPTSRHLSSAVPVAAEVRGWDIQKETPSAFCEPTSVRCEVPYAHIDHLYVRFQCLNSHLGPISFVRRRAVITGRHDLSYRPCGDVQHRGAPTAGRAARLARDRHPDTSLCRRLVFVRHSPCL